MNQAERVISKLGGAAAMAAGTGRNKSSIYRWMHPRKAGGTGGMIPASAMGEVLAFAKREGIALTADDLSPVAS